MTHTYKEQSVGAVPLHVAIAEGIARGRKARSLAAHAAIRMAMSGLRALLRADARARHRHELANLTDRQLRDVGLTRQDVGDVRMTRSDLPF